METMPIVFEELLNIQPGIGLLIPLNAAPVIPGDEIVVQLKLVPDKVEDNVMGCDVVPEQINCDAGVVDIKGNGRTVIL
jgi:hypothetical protein